jgi:methionyl-tRNA synthetase
LVNGRCSIHPHLELELIEEENYFFRFSKYQKILLDLYEKNPEFVVPKSRLNEIRSFAVRGFDDFSISRLASKMSWGVPVLGDENQVMYVWFDALVNYISTLGWPENTDLYEKFWVNGTPVQYCGKDNLRQQSAMWQAMLISAGLTPTHTVVIDGFVTGLGGIKMSKSLGNVVNPHDIVKQYGTDALRYFVLRELQSFEDSPFTNEQFKLSYNANLANGIGNLVSRVLKMAVSYGISFDALPEVSQSLSVFVEKHVENFELNKAMDEIWKKIAVLDTFIQKNEPFKKIKVDVDGAHADIRFLLSELGDIANVLQPFMPVTAEVITSCLKDKKVPEKPLFMRMD